MSVELNHTIIHSTDRATTAQHLSEILGLPKAFSYGPFLVVQTANGVSLDVLQSPAPITTQHYAFLVSEAEFDQIYGRIVERGLTHWSDPFEQEPGGINHNDGGRGVFWCDSAGHKLEIITVPYGG